MYKYLVGLYWNWFKIWWWS